MSSDTRRPWAEIEPNATELARILAPACQDIRIAGSARRGRVDIADVELVAIPRIFDGANALHWLTDALLEQGSIEKALLGEKKTPRWGPKYRALHWRGVHYDLFMTDEDSWGYISWLRTGPGDANEYIARRLRSANAPFKIENGAVWEGETRIAVRTEEDWFRLLNLPYLKPSERTLDKYMELMPRKHVWGVASLLTAAALSVVWDDRYTHPSGRVWVRDVVTTTHKYGLDDFHVGKNEWYTQSQVVFHLLERDDPKAIDWMRWQAKMPPDLRDFYVKELHRFQAKWLPVDEPLDTTDLLPNYFLPVDPEIQTVEIALLTSIESTYSPATVAEYVARETLLDREGRLPFVIQFADRKLLMDGEHRKRAAAARGLKTIEARVEVYAETFAQACGIVETDEEDMLDELFADVLEECYWIFMEAA